MKKKKLVLPLLIVCFAMLMFGVYAAKNAKLNAGGTVGFNAHDCTLTMYGTITGAVSNADNMVLNPNEIFYFGDENNQFTIKDETTLSFAEDLTNNNGEVQPVIYFNDAGEEVPDIVMTYTFTNTSDFPVLVDVKTLSFPNGNPKITTPVASIPAGEMADLVITIELADTETDIETDTTNFNLEIEFAKQSFSVGLEYSPNYNTDGEIVSYYVSGIGTCTDKVIKVPPTYNGLPVVGIGANAFKDQTVVQIILPDSIETIGDGAFSGCYYLEEVNIPSGATVGKNVYDGCESLTGITVTSQDSFESGTSKGVFEGNKNLETIIIGKEVRVITENAFKDCSNLHTVIFEEGSKLEIIKGNAFENCTSLVNIELPETEIQAVQTEVKNSKKASFTADSDEFTGFKEIVGYSFYNCSSLPKINIPQSVTSIGYNSFGKCNNLKNVYISDMEKWFNTNIQYGDGSNPLNNGANLYLNKKLVTEVEVPTNITTINANIFSGCLSLQKFIIHANVNVIKNSFYNCNNLKQIHIADLNKWYEIPFTQSTNPLYNGADLYLNNELVTEVTIPANITVVPEAIFTGCTSIQTINISEGITAIGKSAFYKCINLQSVVFPETCQSIGDSAFNTCRSLTSVDLPESLTSMGSGCFNNCHELNKVYLSDIDKWLKVSFDYNGSPFNCGADLFVNNEIITEITIPSDVKEISEEAIAGCTSIEKIIIPEGVESIGGGAFYNCENLQEVTIPTTLNHIGYQAFCNTNLTNIYVSDIEKWCGIEFECDDFKNHNINLYLNEESISEIIIPDSITVIKNFAFLNLKNITTIVLPSSIQGIGYSAFGGAKVFYSGTAEEFANVTNLDPSYSSRLYYYSETEPTTTGKFWHYVANEETGENVPTIWR